MTCGVAKEYESPALPRLNAFPRGLLQAQTPLYVKIHIQAVLPSSSVGEESLSPWGYVLDSSSPNR